ncbi:MAG TPA: M20/M25/M40 family metallo-hydrolase [Longimicrobiales bacterium]|nr:M20/M25/M40 family metallo-hydrolase [Longimicrobiales bacterium]
MKFMNVLRRAAAALFLLALPGAARAQACPEPAAIKGDLTDPLAVVRYLADDALEGRLAGSPGEACAADYIAGRFATLGLRAAGEDGTFFQAVPLASRLNPHAPAGSGRNVIALLEGTDPDLRDEIVVIGAHYDHLGHGQIGSLAPEERGAIHNGADDNASGVAVMIRAATLLADAPPARSILFLAFTGEESGLLGSAHFVREPTLALAGARAMLNLDMVGRLGDGPLIVYGVETAAEWRALLESEGERTGVELALRPEGYGPSDHTSFYTADIPVLHFFTNTHGDYHRPSDEWDRIDADGLETVARIVTAIAGQAASPPTTLTLQRGAGQPARGAAPAGYGAWLGTVPDFSPVERGVLLGGVTPGSPGDRAGLQRGDLLIRFAGEDVTDLEAFTAVLRRHRPGDEVEVVVLRDAGEVTLRAVLGSRGG